MKIWEGHSIHTDGEQAVAEATRGFPTDVRFDILFCFASTKQDAVRVAAALAQRFPGVPIAGCSTAGELLGATHRTGSLVVTALSSPRIRWTVTVAPELASFDEPAALGVRDRLLAGLGLDAAALDPAKHFCLTFIDGLSCKEEVVSALVADVLEGVPLLGGSAGDDLAFKKTWVFADGKAHGSSAVFVLGESQSGARFDVVKHQHYTTTPKALVITRADVATRRVFEIDGYNARDAYARALGLAPADVTSDVAFMNPLAFVSNDAIYVRSVQRIEPDGSIIFYCAIEEGMVLSLGGHEPMVGALERDIATLEAAGGKADFFLSFNCILRALEAKATGGFDALGATVERFGRHVIGFDTYGEQLRGLHINQTLVGLAIYDAEIPQTSHRHEGASHAV